MPSVLCEELYQIFLRGEKAVPRELPLKLRQLTGLFFRHQATAASLEPIFTLEKRLIAARGPHRQHLETQVFQALFFSTDACEAPHPHAKRLRLEPGLVAASVSSQESQRHQLALKLAAFAQEIFHCQPPARDAFTNKRKCLAMDLIARVSRHYDLPEAVALWTTALQSNKKALILTAIECYDDYRRDRDLPLPPEVVERLNAIAETTKDRTVAVTALNMLVEADLIDEFEAMARIDQWKEKNDSDWL